ncbi:MAG TPA: chaperone modulator CbpM [Chitinophagaceae bacterium]|nr:chaperone modulator CbpM [Chitinophagaceae bacterium]
MEQTDRIEVESCCEYYQISVNFLESLEDAGLIQVQLQEGRRYITHDDLSLLEKFIRLHYDLNINTEGLEAINYMLERMRRMQDELASLRKRFEVVDKSQFT